MLLRTLILIVLFPVSFCLVLRAQTISLHFPDEAGKEYALYVYQGQNRDVVASGKIDKQGKAQIVLPHSHAGFSGVGILAIDNERSRIQMIINNENFSIESAPDGNFIFKNSPENDYMIAAFSRLTPMQVGRNMYAPRFFALLKYQNDLAQLANSVALRTYLRRNLDMEALYTSGLWNNIISGTFNLYRNKKDFGVDMVEVLKRTNNQTVFAALAEDLITICTQFGWETAQDEIVSYLISSQKIQQPSRRLYFAFEQHKVRAGVIAPALKNNGKEIKLKNTLLVFHETGCGSCEQQMQELIRHYGNIKLKGYEIVSVSADVDENILKRTVSNFPWKMKLCDFKHFSGENFINYGIVGTPTIYLINKNGIVEGRYARLQDIPIFNDLYR